MRKKRNVRSVMGWLLRRQLSEPGAGGAVCAGSMAFLAAFVEVASGFAWLMGNALVSFTWLHFSGTADDASAIGSLVELAPARPPRSPHVIGVSPRGGVKWPCCD